MDVHIHSIHTDAAAHTQALSLSIHGSGTEMFIQFVRIRIRIHLLARRNLLWDILRLPSIRRAALCLYVNLML